jgi:phage shock protein E
MNDGMQIVPCLSLVASLALTLASWGASAPVPAPADGATTVVRHVDPAQARKLIDDPKVTILDLRTPGEFKAGHLAGATNLDFTRDDFEANLAKLDKRRTYLIHCASGNRSTRALPTFQKLQFQSVVHLDGGVKAWEKAGQPMVK